jgi:acetyl esterase
MRLDAQTQALLEKMQTSRAPPVHRSTVAQARAMMEKSSAMLGPPGPEVAEVADLAVPVDQGAIRVRRYRPPSSGAGRPVPVLLMCHGGGFVVGDVATHDAIARTYCALAGVMVASVDYRRAPEHPFPRAVEDGYAALCWLAEHAGEWGGDPQRIAVTGDSAGGNLAAVMCQLARARGGPDIAFQALVYPVLDHSPDADYASRSEFGAEGEFLSERDMAWFADHYFAGADGEREDLRASPILAQSLAGLPPALVVTAGSDPLRDEGRDYAERLAAAGVSAEYRCFESTIHGFLSFAGVLDVGREALTWIGERIREGVHGSRCG